MKIKCKRNIVIKGVAHNIGDIVEVNLAKGIVELEIIDICPGDID